ncbi:hypothetical protein Tsubulata_033327 [Turnera subulata]|uniref:Uncharacterized protein n=1 Tax=Turnera subulata TaxID=218843 RepID=A0A9Q0JPM8_9ROSI|nr:hypothetical protein Tsubulata_033327 [Turnera subulata]
MLVAMAVAAFTDISNPPPPPNSLSSFSMAPPLDLMTTTSLPSSTTTNTPTYPHRTRRHHQRDCPDSEGVGRRLVPQDRRELLRTVHQRERPREEQASDFKGSRFFLVKPKFYCCGGDIIEDDGSCGDLIYGEDFKSEKLDDFSGAFISVLHHLQ